MDAASQRREEHAQTAVTVGVSRLYTDRGWPSVAAPVTVSGRQHEVYFRSSRAPLVGHALPFVLTALAPAMKLGLPLRVEAPLPARSLDFLPSVQAMIRVGQERLHLVPVEAAEGEHARHSEQGAQRGVGLFFSGGVDSFHSLLQHQSEITHLIFVHGFDTRLSQPAVRAHNAQALHQVAAETGKHFIEVETNWREVVGSYERWSHETATTAQLSIAALLGLQLEKVYVAENFDYFGEKRIYGIPSVLSAAGVDTILDGTERLRLDKTTRVAASDVAMRWLRVCWQNKSLDYNCGRCEKCLRTMIGLHLAGALGRCGTFQRPLSVERVRNLTPDDSVYFWPELLVALERRGTEPELTEAVRDYVHWASIGYTYWPMVLAELDTRQDMAAICAVVRECVQWVESPAEQRQQAMRLREALARNIELQEELAVIHGSHSWKMTAPLRTLGERYRRLRMGLPG